MSTPTTPVPAASTSDPEGVSPELDPSEAALQQVDASGQGREWIPSAVVPPRDILGVALERTFESRADRAGHQVGVLARACASNARCPPGFATTGEAVDGLHPWRFGEAPDDAKSGLAHVGE